MLVFVDEAGDTGFKFDRGSSRYFVVALVVFREQEQAEDASRKLDTLRQTLHIPNVEFHFAKNSGKTRRAFFLELRQCDFQAFVLTVDKRRLSPAEFPDRASFYRAVCTAAFENAKPFLKEARVYFDAGGGEKFEKELASHRKQALNIEAKRCIREVGMLKSAASNHIQMADMICGALLRDIEMGESEWRESIRAKLTSVVWWPDEFTAGS